MQDYATAKGSIMRGIINEKNYFFSREFSFQRYFYKTLATKALELFCLQQVVNMILIIPVPACNHEY